MFRGKHVHVADENQHLEEVWVYGYLSDGNHINSPDLEGDMLVDPETISQYTGLKDKNRKRIFEGDICKTHYANAKRKRNEFIETIVFDSGRFCAFHLRDGCKSWAGIYNGVPHLRVDKSVYMDELEVIGNIFDNPELIEEVEG